MRHVRNPPPQRPCLTPSCLRPIASIFPSSTHYSCHSLLPPLPPPHLLCHHYPCLIYFPNVSPFTLPLPTFCPLPTPYSISLFSFLSSTASPISPYAVHSYSDAQRPLRFADHPYFSCIVFPTPSVPYVVTIIHTSRVSPFLLCVFYLVPIFTLAYLFGYSMYCIVCSTPIRYL